MPLLQVAVLDMNLFSFSFLIDSSPNPSNPVISMIWKSFVYNDSHSKSPKDSRPKDLDKLIFVCTKDAKLYVFDGDDHHIVNSKPLQLKRDTTVISMHVIEGSTSIPESVEQKGSPQSPKDIAAINEVNQPKIKQPERINTGQSTMESFLLLCCKDALRLYRLKSVVQGNEKPLHKVKLEKPCCWTSTFKKDEKTCGLVLLYQTGELEIRSLPDLDLVKTTSLMSLLRWSFKANMQRTMSSTEYGKIALINGAEVAFISVLNNDDEFWNLESLPSLHDKVLASALEAVISSSQNQKKKLGVPGALVNILKGFRSGKTNNFHEDFTSGFTNLDRIFSKNPFPDPHESTIIIDQEDVELDIDDIEIEIDEPVTMPTTSSHTKQKEETGKRTDRQKLLDDDDADPTPRLRTREEIIAKYRKAGDDASSAAGQARNKLLERQEKLEKISKRTQDLSNEAEDFASLANELVKAMERRKWWQI